MEQQAGRGRARENGKSPEAPAPAGIPPTVSGTGHPPICRQGSMNRSRDAAVGEREKEEQARLAACMRSSPLPLPLSPGFAHPCNIFQQPPPKTPPPPRHATPHATDATPDRVRTRWPVAPRGTAIEHEGTFPTLPVPSQELVPVRHGGVRTARSGIPLRPFPTACDLDIKAGRQAGRQAGLHDPRFSDDEAKKPALRIGGPLLCHRAGCDMSR